MSEHKEPEFKNTQVLEVGRIVLIGENAVRAWIDQSDLDESEITTVNELLTDSDE